MLWPVLAGVLMVLVLVVVLPVAVLIGSGVAAALLGSLLDLDARRRHAGSELVDLNR
jgi:ABC-type transport system involved in cytochrome c biogenesis permease subunit